MLTHASDSWFILYQGVLCLYAIVLSAIYYWAERNHLRKAITCLVGTIWAPTRIRHLPIHIWVEILLCSVDLLWIECQRVELGGIFLFRKFFFYIIWLNYFFMILLSLSKRLIAKWMFNSKLWVVVVFSNLLYWKRTTI